MFLSAKRMELGLMFQDVLSMSLVRSSKCLVTVLEFPDTVALTFLVASAPSSAP